MLDCGLPPMFRDGFKGVVACPPPSRFFIYIKIKIKLDLEVFFKKMFVFISPTHQLGCAASSAPINSGCGGGAIGDPVLRAGEAELHPSPLIEPPTTSTSDSEEDLPPPAVSKNPPPLQPQHFSSESETESGSETKYVRCSLYLDLHNPTNTSVSCTTSAPNTPCRSLSLT